jgi:hypothetical protein
MIPYWVAKSLTGSTVYMTKGAPKGNKNKRKYKKREKNYEADCLITRLVQP